VRLSPETSAAVPGLLYHWGRRDPTSDHGPRPQAIVATRPGTARVLRVPSDWAVVAAGWSPATADAAVAACTELVATVRPRYTDPPVLVGPHTGSNARDSIIAVVYADTLRRFADSLVLSQGLSLATLLSDSAATLFRANRIRLAPPEASSPAPSSWAVALWGLHDHGAFRYGCTFPRPRWWNRAGARMTVTDSIRWPPLPP
jgi:hypothetical protein